MRGWMLKQVQHDVEERPVDVFTQKPDNTRSADPLTPAKNRRKRIPDPKPRKLGYVPTRLAFERGGYETWPAKTSKLVPEAGEMIVDATRKLLQEIF